jgi:hypothetical protein
MANEKTKLSAELSRLRLEIEDLQDGQLGALPADVRDRIEDVLFRLAELTGAIRDAGL